METSKQVDLVMYKKGTRLPLGKVIVEPDGTLSGQVSKDAWSMIKDRFDPTIGELVLAPIPVKKLPGV